MGAVKITGSAMVRAPREDVWRALNDPAVLVRTIPGCQQLEEVGPDSYRMTISAGVASIKGTYQGDVTLTDQQKPGSFVLRASGAGAPGTVSADVKVSLAEHNGGTQLDYDADAVVGGMVGGVGQRMLGSVSKRMAGEFFGNVADAIRAPTSAAGAASPDVTAATGEVGQVFTAPPRPASSQQDLLQGVDEDPQVQPWGHVLDVEEVVPHLLGLLLQAVRVAVADLCPSRDTRADGRPQGVVGNLVREQLLI